MEKKMDTPGAEDKKDLHQPQAAQEGGHSEDVETIASLTEECGELQDEISSRKNVLERFMLVTGGASDDSDRMQERIDSLQDTLEETEKRLQALLDAQEKEFFAPEKKTVGRKNNAPERASLKKRLSEKKAETAAVKPHGKEKGRKNPGRDMEK